MIFIKMEASLKALVYMVAGEGFEPPTPGL